jgi:hypothetical protein
VIGATRVVTFGVGHGHEVTLGEPAEFNHLLLESRHGVGAP